MAKEKHFVFTFGRFQGAHAGHKKLADAVRAKAAEVGGDHAVILSHSHGGSKNPLPPDVKHGMAQEVLGPGHNVMLHPDIKHIGHAVEYAKRNGYTHVHFVGGGDRAAEISKKAEGIGKAVGVNFQVHSAGHRDPDAEGVEGASGTAVREAIKSGDHAKFHALMPKGMSRKTSRRHFDTLTHHMSKTNESATQWFDEDDFMLFLGDEQALMEAAKYLRPDLYLIRKRKQNKVEVVVRPDPDEDVVLKGGPDKQKPTITDVMNHVKKGEFEQTPTSIEIFGDLSAEIKKQEAEASAKTGKVAAPGKSQGGAVGAGAQGQEPVELSPEEAEALAAEQEAQQPLDLTTPMGNPMSVDAIEYPRPTKPLTQGKGVEFEWALVYAGLKASGFSDEQLMARDQQAKNNLMSFSKDAFELAKQTIRNIPQELRAGLMHSDELGIVGDPEPKTDIVSGDARISVKMDGQIQLSSESSKSTAFALSKIAESMTGRDVKFNQEAIKQIEKALAKMPTKMIDPSNLEEAKMRHGNKPWFLEMLDENGEVKDKYNWDIHKKNITPKIQDDLIKFLEENEDFHSSLIHEALTGSIKFGSVGNDQAISSHILWPNGFEEIGDPNGDYVSSLRGRTSVGIRAKSRSRITQPTFRFELKGKKIERLVEKALDVTGSGDYIYTPSKVLEFFSQNPDLITRDVMSGIQVMLSGDLEADEIEQDQFNIITVNGKEVKIPITGGELEMDDEDEINEMFLTEQDDPSKRDYKREYRLFHSKPKERKKRSNRVLARRKMIKKGKARKGDGKDIDHKDGNALNNGDGNLRVRSVRSNRADNKHRKGEKSSKSIAEEHGAGEEGTDKLLNRYMRDTPHMRIIGFKRKLKKDK